MGGGWGQTRPDEGGDRSDIRGAEASHGPCFGTKEHPRRDTDVISRLPDTTTQDLSVFIGFRCSNRVKIIILDESMNFY